MSGTFCKIVYSPMPMHCLLPQPEKVLKLLSIQVIWPLNDLIKYHLYCRLLTSMRLLFSLYICVFSIISCLND